MITQGVGSNGFSKAFPVVCCVLAASVVSASYPTGYPNLKCYLKSSVQFDFGGTKVGCRITRDPATGLPDGCENGYFDEESEYQECSGPDEEVWVDDNCEETPNFIGHCDMSSSITTWHARYGQYQCNSECECELLIFTDTIEKNHQDCEAGNTECQDWMF